MRLDSERPPLLEPGFRIDRYELLFALAQGGMGSVWVARLHGKHGFQKLFAVKMILPQHAADRAFRHAFLDEAHIASSIVHPNVAQTIDLGECDGMLYLAMEYVEGDSLQRLIRTLEKNEETIPLRVAMRIVAGVAAGLHAAHELVDREGRSYEIVHRDVTPHNILVGLNGAPKIIDFGVAKAKHRLSGDTTGLKVKGKIRYIAPEQAMAGPIDRRADVWSAAAVLYILITGRPPYDADADAEALVDILAGRPLDPLPDSVPEPVRRVVHRALSLSADDRYATALELEHALEDAMSQADLRCGTADVAEYVTARIGARIAERRRELTTAVSSVAERARVRKLVDSESAGTASGLSRIPPLPALPMPRDHLSPLPVKEGGRQRGAWLAGALGLTIAVAGGVHYAQSRWGGDGVVLPNSRTRAEITSTTVIAEEADAGGKRPEPKLAPRAVPRVKTIAQSKHRDEDDLGNTIDSRK
jgi:hypothetical protein